MKEKIITTQEWIPIEKINENGIIKLINNKFIKIMKVNPINFNLKSNLEKEENIFQSLNEKYFKIKECLFRCGNIVQEINSKKEIKKLFNLFLNSRIFFN